MRAMSEELLTLICATSLRRCSRAARVVSSQRTAGWGVVGAVSSHGLEGGRLAPQQRCRPYRCRAASGHCVAPSTIGMSYRCLSISTGVDVSVWRVDLPEARRLLSSPSRLASCLAASRRRSRSCRPSLVTPPATATICRGAEKAAGRDGGSAGGLVPRQRCWARPLRGASGLQGGRPQQVEDASRTAPAPLETSPPHPSSARSRHTPAPPCLSSCITQRTQRATLCFFRRRSGARNCQPMTQIALLAA